MAETPGSYSNTGSPADELKQLQAYFRTWANATEIARLKFRRDYEYAEGNGKQWLREDRQKVLRSNRPVLEFNQILPQIETACGMHRDMEIDFKLYPRGYEDLRLAEIATATLKAAMDFGRVSRTSDRVFDDGMITGLGVWEVLHTLEDADDMLWGDILVNRIHPQAFIYDPWSVGMDLQDGAFMGKATWMDLDDFKRKYPKFINLGVPGEWLSKLNALVNASDDLGTGPNLRAELWDEGTGRIRVLTMWCKKPTNLVLMVDEQTGQVQEFPSKDKADEYKAMQAQTLGAQAVAGLQVITQGTTAGIADQTGMPVPDPTTGQPTMFADPQMAQAHLDMLSRQVGLQATDHLQVIQRVAKKPYWTEMVYWQTLDSGPSPFRDRQYPFVPYISRRWADDPESIFGIVRNLWDPQDEYNKRYSNLLAHINSSSHSGWLNRKSGGANRTELEVMGSKPGVVVEYTAEKPEQIKPVEMSQGHFAMLQSSERNILKISGINAEMTGQTTQQTVSGRAIKARQEGGVVGLKSRLRNYEDSQLDLARMIFSRIQQYYAPEKIKRILGVQELNSPMGPGGMPIFMDPATGMPVPDDQIINYLRMVGEVEFDLAFSTMPFTATDRQEKYQTALQISQLVAQSGRPIGPATFNALIDLADMPSQLATALKADAMMPPMGPADPAGQAATIGKSLSQSGKPPANGDGASSGGGNNAQTPGKKQAAQKREGTTPGRDAIGP